MIGCFILVLLFDYFIFKGINGQYELILGIVEVTLVVLFLLVELAAYINGKKNNR